jgi:uncharacterized protein (TIGR02246 family)
MKSLAFSILANTAIAATAFAANPVATVEARNVAFIAAYNAHDSVAVAALYAEDGKILPPGAAAASGREAIAAYWQAGFNTGVGGGRLFTDEATQLDRNNIIEVGHYEILDPKGATMETGKYMVHWRKVGDEWLLYRDIWNTNQ